MKHRHRILILLVLLLAILDRVCISVAGPRVHQDLHIDPVAWGWVTGMFTLSYCLFEIPTGAPGDRIWTSLCLAAAPNWRPNRRQTP